MKRSTTDTCSLTLPLAVEKWQADRLDKRFELGRTLYNTLLSLKLKHYRYLAGSTEYTETVKQMDELFHTGQKNSAEYAVLSKRRDTLLRARGFSEYDFIKAMTPLYRCYNKNIDSNMAQVIARNVWNAFRSFLYGKGQTVHFKKKGQFNALAGKRSRSSIRYADGRVSLNGLTLKVILNPKNQYEQEMLSRRIKFCAIKRIWCKNRYHYRLVLILEGRPANPRDPLTGALRHPMGEGKVGLYLGMRMLAYFSDAKAGLEELAAGLSAIEMQKKALREKMDRSLRSTNPQCYQSNGAIKKGAVFTRSNHYIKLCNSYKDLCRKGGEITKIRHSILANHILALGNEFYINKPDFAGLKKRPANRSSRRRNMLPVRYGRIIGVHSPSRFLQILRKKVENRDTASLECMDLWASHDQRANYGEAMSTLWSRGGRWLTQEDGTRIHRDIYAAYVMRQLNSDPKLLQNGVITIDFEDSMRRQNAALLQA